jgi:hypothetical protein
MTRIVNLWPFCTDWGICFRLLDLVPKHLDFIALSFTIRIVEAVGASAATTAAFAITASVFPDSVATTFVSTKPVASLCIHHSGRCVWAPLSLQNMKFNHCHLIQFTSSEMILNIKSSIYVSVSELIPLIDNSNISWCLQIMKLLIRIYSILLLLVPYIPLICWFWNTLIQYQYFSLDKVTSLVLPDLQKQEGMRKSEMKEMKTRRFYIWVSKSLKFFWWLWSKSDA